MGRTIAMLAAGAAFFALAAPATAAEGEGIGGFYIGAHGGYTTGSIDWTGTANPIPVPPLTSANTADHNTDGFLLGGTVGGRFQTGYMVIGLEAEASWANGDDTTPSTAFAGLSNSSELNWMGTITGQFGIQTGRVHAYLEAGYAFTGEVYRVTDTNGVAPDQTGRISDTRTGPVFGVGFEYLLDGGMSVRGEWNYLNFGNNDYDFGGDRWAIDATRQVFRLGVMYRFGG